MKLAIIPARGGSKRIPGKNIKAFGGRPMIAWSIEAAQKASIFDRIVVSTDDPEIAAIAQRWGAEVPFMRPADLSDDHTGAMPVIVHAINWHVDQGMDPQETCMIYATAPFVQADDISRGLKILHSKGAEFAFSVTSYPFPIQRALKMRVDGRIEMFDPSQFQAWSQDLQEAYHDAGQFYWGTKAAWSSGKPTFGPHSVPVILSRHCVQDIDTPEDWYQAELLFKARTTR